MKKLIPLLLTAFILPGRAPSEETENTANGVPAGLSPVVDESATERSEAHHGRRSGHYDRNLTTASRGVTLHVLRLKAGSFETDIIVHYCRRESCVEEPLIKMYIAVISVRQVGEITD